MNDIKVYGTGELLLKATAFITLPIYTRLFTPSDYGYYTYILTLVGLIGTVIALGGDTAYARLYFEANSDEEKRTLTTTWLTFIAGWSVLVCLALTPLANLVALNAGSVGNGTTLFILGLCQLPITTINSTCAQVLRNQFRPGIFVRLNVMTTLLGLGLGLYAVLQLQMGLLGLLSSSILAGLLMLPVRLYTTKPMLGGRLSGDTLIAMLKFGLPLVPMSLAYWVFSASDRLMLARLSSVEQVGLYAVAANIGSILILVNSALGQAWGPRAIQYHELDPEHAARFFGQFMTYLLAGFGLLSVGMSAFAPEVVRLLAAPSYASAAVAVAPLALAAVASASCQVTALGISLSKKTHHFAVISWAAAALNVLLNLVLLPRWGNLGASVSMAVSYTILTMAYCLVSQRLIPVAYEMRRLLVVVPGIVGFTLGTWLLPELPLISGLLLKSVYCAGYLLVLFLFRAFDQRELMSLRSMIVQVPAKT